MQVSIIIPAHNAAETLGDTLASLLAQTSAEWEAIVVNDGSIDETATVASEFAARDPRIRLVNQAQKGESGARNTGIALARSEWLLFLDADDWLLPEYLERSITRLQADSSVDAVVCGWTRVAPSGGLSDEKHCPQPDNVFELSTRCCPFAIHACVVRRSLVETAGAFDTTLKTCADWDLWQRIARLGARFAAIPEVLARYRMRAASAGLEGSQLLQDGLRVIEQGHSPDRRLRRPAPRYSRGAPRDLLARAQYHFSCWAAGLMLGRGQDASALLDCLDQPESDLDPQQIAWSLFEAVLLPRCGLPADWADIWPVHEQFIDRFLEKLESGSLAPGIALRSRRLLERLAIDRASARRPLIIGRTYAVAVEVTQPISDISPPEPADRLVCEVSVEGKRLGSLELPVCDGLVPAYVLADAVAAKFAWRILGEFWRKTVYADLEVKPEPGGLSICKEGKCLASGLPSDEESFWQKAHDCIGWPIFSERLWRIAGKPGNQIVEKAWFAAEATEFLTDLATTSETVACVPTVGGIPLGLVKVQSDRELVTAGALRAALLQSVGFEPCRIAVREGILGRPFEALPISLWERLETMTGQAPLPGIDKSKILGPEVAKIVLGPRRSDPIGTSASRRAMLPLDVAPEILEAVSGSQQIYCLSPDGRPPSRLVYAPDLMPEEGDQFQVDALGTARRPATSAPAPSLLSRVRNLRRPRAQSEAPVFSDRLPIFMYHRVAPRGDPRNARYRVSPRAFKAQLRYLREAGYASVTLEDWRLAMKDERPLPGRPVLLTFDDGYLDFQTHAWPLLRRYGFSAVLFVVADDVGKSNRWDQARGEELRLLGWDALRDLQSRGVEIASHSATHAPLGALSPADVVREGARSRATLERELGHPIRAFAYPYGIQDEAVQHLIGACGYVFGLSCECRLSGFFDPLLALPRIEVTGSDKVDDFAMKIRAGGVSK